ncbi:MAG: glycosyltransferase involved in cell wall biosynthesis [Parvicellaceae bacterium]|jgi:glycosyltransferase involved in cell wall biosynthesis
MKKRFVTIFPVAENVHLVKDVGQVGNFMSIIGGYESTLVCYKNSEAYPNLETETKNLKLEFLEPCGHKLFMEQAVLNYLNKNAKSIDVLHLFHLTKETIYYGLYFQKLNPKGKIFLKMDVYNETLQEGINYSKKALKNWYHKQKEKKFLKLVNVVTAENPISQKLLAELFPVLKNKCLVMTNGVNTDFLAAQFPSVKSHQEKENVLLSVGRIGVAEKNYKLMIEAVLKTELNDWKVVLVGPVEPEFQVWLDDRLKSNPAYQDKIELIGSVDDRKTLYSYYNRSKVFCLTSPFESFAIAYAEAMYFGNYIIGNDGHSSFDLLSDHERLGAKVPKDDVKALAIELEKTIKNQSQLKQLQPAIKARANSHFSWRNIIVDLVEKLGHGTN